MSDNNILISFLIPMFNCGSTIEKCVKSIIGQFENFDSHQQNYEILVVNDGSIDNGEAIVKQLQDKNSRIILYNQNNRGISYTRKKLFELSEGKYVMFVDADDYLMDNEFIPIFLEFIKSNADAVYFNYWVNGHKPIMKFNKENSIYSSKDFIENIVDFTDIVTLWQFIFKKESITETFDDYDIQYGEDKLFLVKQLPKFSNIYCSNRLPYVYSINENSICHNINQNNYKYRSISMAKVAVELKRVLLSQYSAFSPTVKNQLKSKIEEYVYSSIIQSIRGRCTPTLLNILEEGKIYPYYVVTKNISTKKRIVFKLFQYKLFILLYYYFYQGILIKIFKHKKDRNK
ncbi:MAG: glycosyltransferase family 2 protein [Bacteroides sp.]|nr:glycosyltransferase family 2 protein [Bacteroides sp.]